MNMSDNPNSMRYESQCGCVVTTQMRIDECTHNTSKPRLGRSLLQNIPRTAETSQNWRRSDSQVCKNPGRSSEGHWRQPTGQKQHQEHENGDELFVAPRGGGSEGDESTESAIPVQDTSHEHRDAGAYEPSSAE